MKIAILHDSPKPTWSSRRLMKAIEEEGHQPVYVLNTMLSSRLGYKDCGVLIGERCFDADAVIVRSLGRGINIEVLLKRLSILYQLEKEGKVIVNSPGSLLVARNKYLSLLLLHEAGVPVPRTLLTEDLRVALKTLSELGKSVIKPLTGSLGLGSFYVDSVDMGYRILNAIASLAQPIYVQEFIEKKKSRDVRVFVVGDNVVAAAYRISESSWKTNIAQGARAEPAKITPELEELSIKVLKVLGLEYSGIDIAEDQDGNYYVLEANASPLWRGLQQATGVDPAKHIVRHVINLVKR
ncbi:MAG: RimK family alpha-L-glutamate ligase [Pyrodictiaceae archaeon]